MSHPRWPLLGLLVLTLTVPASAAVRSVPVPYPTIQAAVDAAAPGDSVLISPGTYAEDVIVRHVGITLSSVDAALLTQVRQVTVAAARSEEPFTRIDGLSVTNGLSNNTDDTGWTGAFDVRNCRFGPFAGVTIRGASSCATTITDCRFEPGQGILVSDQFSPLTVSGCQFQSSGGISIHGGPVQVSECTLEQGSIYGHGEGRGVWVRDCELQGGTIGANTDSAGVITGNRLTGGGIQLIPDSGWGEVSGNTLEGATITVPAPPPGAAPTPGPPAVAAGRSWYQVSILDNQLTGGAIALPGTVVWALVRGNVITGAETAIMTGTFTRAEANTIRSCAVGIDCSWGGSTSIVGNDIRGCTDVGILSPVEAGGSLLEENVVAHCGRGIVFAGGSCRRNTVTGCAGEGLLVRYQEFPPLEEVSRMILVGNGHGCTVEPGVDPSVFTCNDAWSNAAGNWSGIADPAGQRGNFSLDPLFCDPDFGEYALAPGSPCLPGGHPDGADCGIIGALGAGCTAPADAPGNAPIATSGSRAVRSIEPNPAIDSVTFTLDSSGTANTLEVYAVTGARVRVLGASENGTARTVLSWDLRGESGARVPPGTYFVRVRGSESGQARKLVVLG